MRVFLLHGMARTAASMVVLAQRLKAAGHRPKSFNYHVAFETLEGIASRFTRRVQQVLEEDAGAGVAEPAEPYAVIGHSLGNVITRLATPELPAGLARFIMLAPPNRPPISARKLGGNTLFQLVTGDAGRQLNDEEFFTALPRPPAPTLIIAGTAGPDAAWLPFSGEPNDGILTVEETALYGVPLLELPLLHTFIMNRKDVFAAIDSYLADASPGAAAGAAGTA